MDGKTLVANFHEAVPCGNWVLEAVWEAGKWMEKPENTEAAERG